ncbi:hypothetical protein [Nostoc sp. KVJ20]|nr:hypothetical protein [Nostoc sp. KVJ20]
MSDKNVSCENRQLWAVFTTTTLLRLVIVPVKFSYIDNFQT